MMLTGVMSKMGVYGFIRIVLPIFAPQLNEPRVLNVLLSLAVVLATIFTFMPALMGVPPALTGVAPARRDPELGPRSG